MAGRPVIRRNLDKKTEKISQQGGILKAFLMNDFAEKCSTLLAHFQGILQSLIISNMLREATSTSWTQ